jgi:hypothetical protein
MTTQGNQVDMADSLNRFLVPDFVVFTATGRLVSVQSSSFEEYDAEKRKVGYRFSRCQWELQRLACL